MEDPLEEIKKLVRWGLIVVGVMLIFLVIALILSLQG
jgi:hypothetical protein